ncbi:hypothetical protein COLO4_33005 [Corchorus olitorius]|uniref:Uncharacterized protein n=1 Tax=Corchorus olitorius TaxID=93759 RepID=A0A1R3GWZ8_9ROSI|nr:hypothetical protein COLO4_33005 [Corchorus olitorius]
MNTSNQGFAPTNLEYYQQYDQQNLQQVNVNNGVENYQNPDDAAATDLIMEQPAAASSLQGNEGNYIDNCNEDMFSSFLDSLMNENLFDNQLQQPNAILEQASAAMASTQNFSTHGNIWEAEIMSSMLAFGNELNSFTTHQQYQP